MESKSIMWKYIEETPSILENIIKNNDIKEIVYEIEAEKIKDIIFVASGSSLNVCYISKHFYEKYSNITTRQYTPQEFEEINLSLFNSDSTMIVAISQTGTSTGTVNSILKAKKHHFKVLALSENITSPVCKESDYFIRFDCGQEYSNAKTKGYSSSLLKLYLLALELGLKKKVIEDNLYNEIIDEIKLSIEDIKCNINTTIHWLEHNREWAKIDHFLIIGHGSNLGTAMEGMLKITETLCIPATFCDIGEFSHGFHRMIDHHSNLILLKTSDDKFNEYENIEKYFKDKVNHILVIEANNENDFDDNKIQINYYPYTQSSINISICIQVIAIYIPEILGLDPNRQANDSFTKLVKTRVE